MNYWANLDSLAIIGREKWFEGHSMVDIYDGDRPVPWDEARKVNLANWNERAEIHRRSYGLERYLFDPNYLSAEVRKDLPLLVQYSGRDSLHGASIAHLQCHIGTDTVSLARLGAVVTGLDFSPAALNVAAQLAHDCGLDVRWVEADVMETARAIGHQVDIVYTSIGTICWLADLDRWAAQIAELVAPGGIFLIRDGHPMAFASEWADDRLEIRHRYFPNGRAQVWETTTSYSGDESLKASRHYEFPHSLSEIIGALLGAGLRLEHCAEGRELPWPLFPIMEEGEDGQWRLPERLRGAMPLSFTLVCSRQ